MKFAERNSFGIFSVIAVFCLCSWVIVNSLFAEKGAEDIELMKNAPSTFEVTVTMTDAEGKEISAADDIAVFRIKRAGFAAPQERYELFYFLDGRLEGRETAVALPFDFKQTYRGLVEGSYQVMFVLKNPLGETAKTALTIPVSHSEKKITP